MGRILSRTTRGTRLRFDGWIAGLGTSSGVRIVLGHWPESPFGPFSDVMLERADGERMLLAPTRETADFVRGTYTFDTVRLVPVGVHITGDTWTVTAGPLDLRFITGRRRLLGYVLRAVPGALAGRPAWSALTDRPARLLLPGVRTRGSTDAGHREWYGARDLLPIRTVAAAFEGTDLGGVAPVEPPVRFGFGSVPRRPALTRVTTTVALIPEDGPGGTGCATDAARQRSSGGVVGRWRRRRRRWRTP
ncbi:MULTISPECIES: hypothetical protein [Streptomyces]|uniref:hypothetical protein n=1 Tax=Streptomyces TaxID=1883 RepID=UPI000AC3D633|nr:MULTISPECIES: hypothetical protein [Streptomyces]MCO8305151.1 hypothetical protein [Streptomyces sp. RKCA744]